MVLEYLKHKIGNIMSKNFLVTILIISTLFSCSLDDDGNNSNLSLKTLPIKEAVVPAEFIFGQSYTLKVIYDLPSKCHSFHNLFYQYEGTSRIVAVNSIVNINLGCADTLIEKEYDFIVRVTQHEDYTFKFWKGKNDQDQDIFENILVPVLEP